MLFRKNGFLSIFCSFIQIMLDIFVHNDSIFFAFFGKPHFFPFFTKKGLLFLRKSFTL